MLPAGKRDRRIAFESATAGPPTPSGEPVVTWGTYFECWSERKDLTGSELFRAQQLAAKATVRYRIPYPYGKSVTPREGLRIVDQGRTYDIRYVSEVGLRGREGLELLAEARAE